MIARFWRKRCGFSVENRAVYRPNLSISFRIQGVETEGYAHSRDTKRDN